MHAMLSVDCMLIASPASNSVHVCTMRLYNKKKMPAGMDSNRLITMIVIK
jgi:hypothetical protein